MLAALSPAAIAARCSRHPWRVVAAWAAAAAGALALIGGFLGDALTTDADLTGSPESIRAERLLEERLRGETPIREVVIVRSETLTVDEPEFVEFVSGLGEDLRALGPQVIQGGTSYYLTRDESLVSADRRTTLLPLVLAGGYEEAADAVGSVLRVTRAADVDPRFDVLQNGLASVGKDFEQVSKHDLQTGEVYGLIAALVILVLVFGAVVAALVPALLALVAIAVALGAVALIGQATQLSFFVVNMAVGMGLALGIDYSLFIVSRFREERARGDATAAAISVAGATAGRAVLFSGATFVLALLGMLLVPTTVMRSLAAGAILVGIASVIVALTLLPAVLALLGDRVNAVRLPLVQRRLSGGAEGRLWAAIARAVMRRPALSLVLSAGVLLAATVPAFQLETGAAGVSTLPEDLPTRQAFDVLEREFEAGRIAPVEVVVDGDSGSAEVEAAIGRLEAALADEPAFGAATVEVNEAGDLTLVSLPLVGDPNADAAVEAVRALRAEAIPAAFAGVDADVLVGGVTAKNSDFFDVTDRYRPIVFGFVLGFSFLLLTVAFRSIVVPAKAIALNLLSVGAAYGLLVLVFQKGYLAGLFGFQQVDSVEAWLPLFLFSVLFGLSMDYHVFLLSRIRERYDATGDNAGAVAFGIGSTARLITGAALIMVAVFCGFALGELAAFQQMGFGLAVALFLDATLIRSVLVPASMKLLGRWNWYLPGWLAWLPRAGIEESR
ncbi:MAG: MMPL family transporter [Thermoleophilia bacterium]|nr:MMPL family transporter [Thermoleophilia bacterium]